MKCRLSVAVIAVLCISLYLQLSRIQSGTGSGEEGAVDPPMPKITVLNPLGTPPPIKLKNMAPRLDTLDGKTIYHRR